DAAVLGHDPVDDRAHVVAVGDVEALGARGAAVGPDAGDERVEAVGAAGAEDDVVALAREAERRGLADAAAGAGDEDDLGGGSFRGHTDQPRATRRRQEGARSSWVRHTLDAPGSAGTVEG